MEVVVEHAVDPDPAGGDSGAIEVDGCCRGLLFIDGEPRLALDEFRRATVSVPAGKYRLAVEVEGFRRWETIVNVAPGDRVFMKPRR